MFEKQYVVQKNLQEEIGHTIKLDSGLTNVLFKVNNFNQFYDLVIYINASLDGPRFLTTVST